MNGFGPRVLIVRSEFPLERVSAWAELAKFNPAAKTAAAAMDSPQYPLLFLRRSIFFSLFSRNVSLRNRLAVPTLAMVFQCYPMPPPMQCDFSALDSPWQCMDVKMGSLSGLWVYLRVFRKVRDASPARINPANTKAP